MKEAKGEPGAGGRGGVAVSYSVVVVVQKEVRGHLSKYLRNELSKYRD